MLLEAVNTSLIPIKMCASVVKLDQFMPDWTLSQLEKEDSDLPRTFIYRVQFDIPFSNIPVVQVGLSGFDIDNRDSARISVLTDAITAETFNIVIKTWRNTRIYSAEISWIALGQV